MTNVLDATKLEMCTPTHACQASMCVADSGKHVGIQQWVFCMAPDYQLDSQSSQDITLETQG